MGPFAADHPQVRGLSVGRISRPSNWNIASSRGTPWCLHQDFIIFSNAIPDFILKSMVLTPSSLIAWTCTSMRSSSSSSCCSSATARGLEFVAALPTQAIFSRPEITFSSAPQGFPPTSAPATFVAATFTTISPAGVAAAGPRVSGESSATSHRPAASKRTAPRTSACWSHHAFIIFAKGVTGFILYSTGLYPSPITRISNRPSELLAAAATALMRFVFGAASEAAACCGELCATAARAAAA
mmetsp:Transcript_10523/g.36964  ORF Transcript_10523/g.36964 Transcript_10523/m.36964 type:complete len:242 (+) Transcript_10523:823-1548(+)